MSRISCLPICFVESMLICPLMSLASYTKFVSVNSDTKVRNSWSVMFLRFTLKSWARAVPVMTMTRQAIMSNLQACFISGYLHEDRLFFVGAQHIDGDGVEVADAA